MKLFPRLSSVTSLENFKLALKYADGVSGTIDLKPAIFGEDAGVFTVLRDYTLFSSVVLDPEIHCPVWPNGLDISPDQAYLEICGLSYEMWSASEYAHAE